MSEAFLAQMVEIGLPDAGGLATLDLDGAAIAEDMMDRLRAPNRSDPEHLRHPMPARPDHRTALYVASDAARTYMIVVTGPVVALAAADADIQALLGGVPAPGAATAATSGPKPAGIRSVPGY